MRVSRALLNHFSAFLEAKEHVGAHSGWRSTLKRDHVWNYDDRPPIFHSHGYMNLIKTNCLHSYRESSWFSKLFVVASAKMKECGDEGSGRGDAVRNGILIAKTWTSPAVFTGLWLIHFVTIRQTYCTSLIEGTFSFQSDDQPYCFPTSEIWTSVFRIFWEENNKIWI